MIEQYHIRALDTRPLPKSDYDGGGSYSEGYAATPSLETGRDATMPRRLKLLFVVLLVVVPVLIRGFKVWIFLLKQ